MNTTYEVGSLIVEQIMGTRPVACEGLDDLAQECGLPEQAVITTAGKRVQKAIDAGYRKLADIYYLDRFMLTQSDLDDFVAGKLALEMVGQVEISSEWRFLWFRGKGTRKEARHYLCVIATRYNRKPMPAHVLLSYKQANQSGLFDMITVWGRNAETDPYVVGIIKRCKTWHYFLIDQWDEDEELQ